MSVSQFLSLLNPFGYLLRDLLFETTSSGFLDVSTFNEVLSSIPDDDKPIFSIEMAQKVYINYLCRNRLDDSNTIDYLSKICTKKHIFIIDTEVIEQKQLFHHTGNQSRQHDTLRSIYS